MNLWMARLLIRGVLQTGFAYTQRTLFKGDPITANFQMMILQEKLCRDGWKVKATDIISSDSIPKKESVQHMTNLALRCTSRKTFVRAYWMSDKLDF